MAGKRGLAEQIRVGLEEVQTVQKVQSKTLDPLEQLLFRKTVRQHVKEFGALFATIFLAISAFLIWRQTAPYWTIALLLLSTAMVYGAYAAPRALHPVWKGWMKFAEALGVLVTSLILFTAWSLIVIPMALLLRIIGKRVMDCTYKAPVGSYWEEREPGKDDFKLLERQY